MDFSKFDEMFDVATLKKDIENANENEVVYKEVPLGTYVVKIEKMELTETGPNSKAPGSPMVKVMFRIIEGDYKKSCLFMNQVVTQPFQIHLIKEFLNSLDSGLDITFDSFTQFGNLILDIHEKIANELEYELSYGEHNGFKVFKITEVYDV